MTIEQLAAIREVACAGTVTGGARNLHRSQPAITRQIHLLERELGCTLLKRRGWQSVLTPEGQVVYAKANEIFERLAALKDELARTERDVSGSLRVGCTPVPAAYLLPGMIQRFVKRYPAVSFSVLERQSHMLPGLLMRGEIDLGMGLKPPQTHPIAFEPLCEDSLVLACARRSPLAQATRLTQNDLGGVPLIRYLPGTSMREVIDAHLTRPCAGQHASLEMNSTESILALVRLNLGIALVPALLLDALKPKGVVARRFEPHVSLTFGFCYISQKYPSALLRTFLSFTKLHWRRP